MSCVRCNCQLRMQMLSGSLTSNSIVVSTAGYVEFQNYPELPQNYPGITLELPQMRFARFRVLRRLWGGNFEITWNYPGITPELPWNYPWALWSYPGITIAWHPIKSQKYEYMIRPHQAWRLRLSITRRLFLAVALLLMFETAHIRPTCV